MSDFSYQKNIERFYSYSTLIKSDSDKSELHKNNAINFNGSFNSFISILKTNTENQSSRFVEGFYPIENRTNRWMSRKGIILIDVFIEAKYFFLKGYFPDGVYTNNRLELNVYCEENLIGTINICNENNYTGIISIDNQLLKSPRNSILIRIEAHSTFIPVQKSQNSVDHRELSLIVDSLGFVESKKIIQQIDENIKSVFIPDQPLAPYFKGTCNVCGSQENFTLENILMIRESFRCSNCGSANRTRQLVRGLLNYFQTKGYKSNNINDLANELDGDEIKIYDTDSNYFVASLLKKFNGYITSDFLENVDLGKEINKNHFCQDLSNLTFKSNSFDVVLSSDVFEHVRLYEKAINEIFRVLKPGGIYLFTVPFKSNLDYHETYIDVVEHNDPSKDIAIKEKVFHGDTLNNTGALLYRIYGKQLFEEFENGGFNIKYERSTIPNLGIYDCDLFIAYKPEEKTKSIHLPITINNQQSSSLKNNSEHNECKLLNIELSSICNLRCKWCILDHSKPAEYLNLFELKKIMTQIQNGELNLLERIELHNGGETLLHPKIDAALEIIKEARIKFSKPIFITLLTNGTTLKESTLQLLASGEVVDEIRVSIDGGSVESFEEIRKNAKWNKVASNVNRFRETINQFSSKTKLGIISTVPPDKPDSISWMEEDFKKVLSLADYVEIRHPHSWEGSLPESSGLIPKLTEKRADRLCKFLKNDIVVLASGKVTVCCADLNGRGIIGDVSKNSLIEIFLSEERQNIVSLWKNENFDEIPLCATCEGYYDTELVTINANENQIDDDLLKRKTKEQNELVSTLQILQSKLEENNFFEIELIFSRLNSNILRHIEIKDFQILLNEKVETQKNMLKWTHKKSAQKVIQSENFIEKNKLDNAENLLFEVLSIEPRHTEALNNLAVVYILKEDHKNAYNIIKYLLNYDSQNEVALGNLEYLKSVTDISLLINSYTEIYDEDAALSDYEKKLKKEIAFYADSIVVHDLPEIHNTFSNAFLGPQLKLYAGFESYTDWWIDDINKLIENTDRVVNILSLGCGNGDTELEFLKKIKYQDSIYFLGLDINPNMVERANKSASANNQIYAQFKVEDLNKLKLQKKFDVFIANHSLHHLVNLEGIFEELAANSSDEMMFLINDMIGKNGHQMWSNTKKVVEDIWKNLDLKYKYNAYFKRFDKGIMDIDCSTDGFEGIRAQDILPLLNQYFDLEFYFPFATIINRFTDRAYGHNFKIDDPTDVELILKILKLDVKLLEEKKLSPTQAFIKAVKKGNSANKINLFQTPAETIKSQTEAISSNYYKDLIEKIFISQETVCVK